MRVVLVRQWLKLGFAAAVVVNAWLTACDSSSANGVIAHDAGPDAIDVIASDVVVYVGSPATLDAAQTGGASFAWSVKLVPSGSGVSTASLGGTTASRATFVPDVAGEYQLEVTAMANGVVGTKTVTVTATPAPVFFLRATIADGGGVLDYHSIGSDRSNDHSIACPVQRTDKPSRDQLVQDTFVMADTAMDWWEAPAGTPSRIAYTIRVPSGDGGTASFLTLGSTNSSCETPPVVVGHLEDAGEPAGPLYQPRYSPDGARIAFIERLASGYTVETVGHDGSARRRIGRLCPEGRDDCSASKVPDRPQWYDPHTVGWARVRDDDAGLKWEVVLADDSASPDVRVHMVCNGATPRTIAFLRDGSVVANATVGGIADLVVYRPSPVGAICQVLRNLTNLPKIWSYARDFAVSPDESEIAFLRRGTLAGESPPDAGEADYGGMLYVVPTSGALAASAFGGAGEYALLGPRYVASASQLVWNGVVDSSSAPDPRDGGTPAIKASARSGTDIRTIVVSDVKEGRYVLGGGNGGSVISSCSAARRQRRSAGGYWALAAGIAATLRRRRRPLPV